MESFIQIPPDVGRYFLKEVLEPLLKDAIAGVAKQLTDGEMTMDEAHDASGEIAQAAGTLFTQTIDDIVALPPGMEEISDILLHEGVAKLEQLMAKGMGDLAEIADEAIGYNPLRASKRFVTALERGKTKRATRIAKRLHRRSPALAEALGIVVAGDDVTLPAAPE